MNVQLDLVPNDDLYVADSVATSDPTWTVRGGRPAFEADTSKLTEDLPAGWMVVTVDVEFDDPFVEELGRPSPVTLRFLPAVGSVALARRPVPEVRGRRIRVVHIPPGTARVEVEVSPWIDAARAESVSFRPIASGVAATMMSGDVAASSMLGSTDRGALSERLRAALANGGARNALAEIAVAYEHLQHRRAGDSVDYPSWRMRNAVTFDDDIDRLRAACSSLPGGGPSISIVMPVFNPDPALLREAIDSIRSQSYDRWQLVAVDDASTDPEVWPVLEAAASTDPRILVRRRFENGHIADATNDALEVATGEFVAFMDHDDLLAPFALGVVALHAREADVLYTDEDKIDADGRHYDPHCKPPWNPELLLGQNYMSHLTVIRRSVVNGVGGLRVGFEGAQDHDLLLRVLDRVPTERILHLPFVAYHWRAVDGSTALSPEEKTYTEDASIRALEEHLGDGWQVGLAGAPTAYRCTPPLVDTPLVSILIPTRDRVELIEQCINSLQQTSYPAFEIIVIDNNSTDPKTLAWMNSFDDGDRHRVVRSPGNFNYSRVNNEGAAVAKGDLLLLLNNDTEVVEPDWLTSMVRWAQRPEVGIVGAKLLYPNDTIQHAGVVLGLGGLAGHGHLHEEAGAAGYFNRLRLTHEVGAVTGACLLTWKSDWHALGGLDEELAVAFNDVDYCLRVRHDRGRRVIWCPDAVLYHHESVSRGAEDDPVKIARFNAEVDLALDRWSDRLGDDPAYSPNLSLSRDAFTLAREPRVTPPWAEEP